MSKKKAGLRCRNCRRPVKGSWMACPQCRTPTERGEETGKAAGSAVMKSAAAVRDAHLARLARDRYSHDPAIAVAAQAEYNRIALGLGGDAG